MFGISAAALALTTCMNSCTKVPTTQTAPKVDFKMDLTLAKNKALTSNGGYMYYAGVIVARTNAGAFIAVSQACTHQGVDIVFQGSASEFVCPAHGSTFGPTGSVGNGPANVNLKSYSTALSGTTLHVWG